MLNANEIKTMIASGESQHLDLKASVPAKVRELAEEVCSFANADGGHILIGVNNQNQIVGATVDNNRRSAIQDSINAISPSVACQVYSVKVDGKDVWCISIPRGTNRPYIYGGGVYVRQGANAQMLRSRDEILEFFKECNTLHYDDQPAVNVDLTAELDSQLFALFCQNAKISATVGEKQILQSLHAYDEATGNPKAGAVMFFAKEPDRYYPQSWIHCVRFRGTDNVFILDDKRFHGPLYNQYTQTIEWLRDKLELRIIVDNAGPHTEMLELPEDALREALINALSHRDYYETGAVIVVALYDDRLVISNPGGLLPQVAENFGHKSLSRNPLIFSLFTRMQQVEQVGSGIPRMRQLMRQMNLPEPTFSNEGFFSITFMRSRKDTNEDASSKASSKASSNKPQGNRDIILQILRNNPQTTISAIAATIHIAERNVRTHLKKLQDDGVVSREGSNRNGKWVVNKNTD